MKNFIFYILMLLLFVNCENEKSKQSETNKIEKSQTINNQINLKFVNAESGLNYRNKPKGEILGKLLYGDKVEIIENSGVLEKIKDGNKIIIGEWVGVKNGNKTIYVFDGFLVDEKQFNTKEYKVNNNEPPAEYDLHYPENSMWGNIIVFYDKDSVDFKITVNNQSGCLSELSGETKIKENVAFYKFSDNYSIKMNFIKKNNAYQKIIIEENLDKYIIHGEGCTFDGIYER